MDNFDLMGAPQHHMSVCPHDTAKNVYGWFFLNSYLQTRLGTRMRFEPQSSFLEERQAVVDGDFHLVYANPYSAAVFARDRGFVPVAAPVGLFDETVLISRVGWDLSTADRPIKVASATDKLVIHALGLTLLPQLGIDPANVEFVFAGNHLLAAKAVLTGAADLGFVFNETWASLDERTRKELAELAVTSQGVAFHCFMVGGEFVDRAAEISSLFSGMADDPAGITVLAEIGQARGIEKVDPIRLQRVSQLIGL